MSDHTGHRRRMKDRFVNCGLDNFEPHEVLEMMLYYCIPRRDTNEIAHRLIERFGTFDQVLDASVGDLEKVEGVGKNAAEFISFARSIGSYYHTSCVKKRKILNNLEECGQYISAFFDGKKNETVYLLCLDAKCKVLGCFMINEGGLNAVEIAIQKVVQLALSVNASSVILAHNHPGGLAIPSQEDRQTTLRIAKALQLVQITLCDHIIVADGDYISFVESDMYHPGMLQEG